MSTRSTITSFWILIFLPSLAFASWEDYHGTTQWNVDITERGCGTDTTDSYIFVIKHDGPKADISDPVHGRTAGAFAGDTLTIPRRIVPDGQGSSRISSTAVSFSCTALSTTYQWNYEDPNTECSGTTTWKGRRIDGSDCPSAIPAQKSISTQITESRTAEQQIQAALAKDPKDFWANWDMAELNKKKGDYKGYYTYLNRATAHEQIFSQTRQSLKAQARKELGISSDITPESTPILRSLHDEVFAGGIIYNINFPQPKQEHQQRWKTMLWATLIPDSSKMIHDLAGVPEVKDE